MLLWKVFAGNRSNLFLPFLCSGGWLCDSTRLQRDPRDHHPNSAHPHYGELIILIILTMSYAALCAADLDWIVVTGYSSGGYILGCSRSLASALNSDWT